MKLRTIAATLMLTFGAAAYAQTLDDARFSTSVTAWLSGNDEKSLTTLSELAQNGHRQARLLLARIETLDRGPSTFRLGLSRDEARQLFRQTKLGDTFSKSWLRVLAEEEGDTLAKLLLAANRAEVSPDLIVALTEAGEIQATDRPTRIAALYGSDELRAALLEDGAVLDELRPYVEYLAGPSRPRGDGLAALAHILNVDVATLDSDDTDTREMAGLLALGWGFGKVSPLNAHYDTVADWVLTAEATRPIASLCSAECVDGERACAMTMLALSGGYFEIIRLDSPLEEVIPQGKFLASPRARVMALRRAALARAETGGLLASVADIAEVSACAAGMIEAERQP